MPAATTAKEHVNEHHPRPTLMSDFASIFINYRREDVVGHARLLHSDLCQQFDRNQLFFDLDSIEGGDVFPDRLRREVERCAVLLALIGRGWLDAKADDGRRLDDASDFVRQEIALALVSGKKVIPVLFDDVPMPPAAQLPEPLKALAKCDALTLRGKNYEYDVQFRELVRLLRSELPDETAQFSKVSLRILGLTSDVVVREATLVSISQPMAIPAPQVSSSQSSPPPDIYTRLWFKFDDKRECGLDLKNIPPPGREGTRVTLLVIEGEKGEPFWFSLYNHPASSWIRLNAFNALFRHVCQNWLTTLDLSLLLLMALSFIMASFVLKLQWYFIVVGLLFGISFLILNTVRCAKLWRVLHDVRENSIQAHHRPLPETSKG